MKKLFKYKYDSTLKKYLALKKEMIYVGKFTWIIVDRFDTKQGAEQWLMTVK